ncbi:hypothetical protein ACODG4_00765 [Vagococcus fluvialis]|uniref:hypothetical protein n=1 Tax=Vagococcus fluvialis TaxID=2738 RepID=UPI00289174FF|nr:hypothetical protein [Vagococcus fluvialis]MDT2781958.1 hypothetical protein [Vagococcus fluvialis]
MFQNGDVLTNWLFLGIAISGFLIIIAFFMKRSDGLFLARTITQYQSDKNNPKYDTERHVGNKATNFILKFVPPFFIAFLILLILKTLNLL